MTQQAGFESVLSAWFEAEAPLAPPDSLVAGALAVTSRARPLPAWRALLTVPVMRSASVVSVGSPSLRMARVLFAVLLATALLAVTATVGARLLEDQQPPLPPPQPVPSLLATPIPQVTTAPVEELIVYAAPPDGTPSTDKTQLVVADPDGTTAPRVIYEISDGTIAGPTISAEGNFVAFRVDGIDPICSELHVLDLRSGDDTVDLIQYSGATSYAWSPIGNEIAFPTSELCAGVDGVDAVDVDTGADRRLLESNVTVDASPRTLRKVAVEAWSPDRQQMAVTVWWCHATIEAACTLHGHALVISTAAEQEPREVIFSPTSNEEAIARLAAAWSPGGSRLMILNGFEHLELFDSDLSMSDVLGRGLSMGSWSPDGKFISWFDQQGAPLSGAFQGEGILEVKGTAGGLISVIGHASGIDILAHPKWTPDGSRIYWSDSFGTWTIKPDGTELTQLDLPRSIEIDWGTRP